MPDVEEVLTDNENETIEEAAFERAVQNRPIPNYAVAIPPDPAAVDKPEEKPEPVSFKQWAVGANNQYTPVGSSIPSLPAGVYEPYAAASNWGLERMKLASDEIYELPDMATNVVLEETDRFWNNEDKYRKHNLLYKRGMILYGPPGSGKTMTIKLLIRKLILRNGIVIIVHNVPLAILALKAIKRIEPTRNIICILEDIDEIIQSNGESIVLSMLDGEHNVDRILNVATTNFPDVLGARIINRPSRFDRVVEIRMPNSEARAFYLQKVTSGTLSEDTLKQWVVDTENMSIAHLRELVAAVYCLDQPYEEVIERLTNMAIKIKPENEFKSKGLGFSPVNAKKSIVFTATGASSGLTNDKNCVTVFEH